MIVVFGSINLDLIFSLPHIPTAGDTVLSPTLRQEPGGKGANQALAAARDGASVVLAGAIGRDALADAALALLRAQNVDLTRVVPTAATTGCAAIAVDPAGRNAISVGSGANLLARADQLEDALLGPGTTLLLQMEVPANQNARLIARARARGARVVLNLAPAMPLAHEALRAVDVLLVNQTEAQWLGRHLQTGDDAETLHAALGVAVVRTLGEGGVEAAYEGGRFRLPARHVVPVDTTAAGDCFSGVLAAALDRGATLEHALARANAAASLCCMRHGSQTSIPTAAEIDAIAAR
jgi:ribokinase